MPRPPPRPTLFPYTTLFRSASGNTLTLTTTNGGPLTLAANVSAAGGTVDLISAGLINQTAGIVTTGALTGSSAGGASLNQANLDRKSTRLNSSHPSISYAVF